MRCFLGSPQGLVYGLCPSFIHCLLQSDLVSRHRMFVYLFIHVHTFTKSVDHFVSCTSVVYRTSRKTHSSFSSLSYLVSEQASSLY